MQPEITREWLAEQLALCEKYESLMSVIGDSGAPAVEYEPAIQSLKELHWAAAARTGYPLLLRKLMEAMDETPLTPEWLASIGFEISVVGKSNACPPREMRKVWQAEFAPGGTPATPYIAIDQDGDASIDCWEIPKKLTTRAAVLALLAAIGVGAKEQT